MIGKLNDAIESFETVVPLSRTLFGTNHEFTLGQQLRLASAYSSAGRHEDAVRRAEATLPLHRNTAGDEGSLGAMQALAIIYLAVPDGRRAADAVELLEEAVTIVRQHQPQSTSAVSLGDSLAYALSKVGRIDQAVQVYDGLLPLNVKVHGDESRDTAGWMATIGRGYARLGRPDLAVPVLEAALPLCGRFHGPNANMTLSTIQSLTLAYLNSGRLVEGQRLLTAAASGSPPNPWAALNLAAFQIWTSDHEGYAATRDRLLQWAASTADATTAHRGGTIQPGTKHGRSSRTHRRTC